MAHLKGMTPSQLISYTISHTHPNETPTVDSTYNLLTSTIDRWCGQRPQDSGWIYNVVSYYQLHVHLNTHAALGICYERRDGTEHCVVVKRMRGFPSLRFWDFSRDARGTDVTREVEEGFGILMAFRLP